jgi:hypothetical protein
MTLAGLFWAMGSEEVIAKLIKKTLYVGAFAYIIGNFNTLAGIIFRSFAGLGLLASGSGLTQAQLLQPGAACIRGHHRRAAALAADRTAVGLSRSLLESRQHRGAVSHVDHRDRELLHPGGSAIRDADRVQADHARRLRPRALRALEQDGVSRRKSAREM